MEHLPYLEEHGKVVRDTERMLHRLWLHVQVSRSARDQEGAGELQLQHRSSQGSAVPEMQHLETSALVRTHTRCLEAKCFALRD